MCDKHSRVFIPLDGLGDNWINALIGIYFDIKQKTQILCVNDCVVWIVCPLFAGLIVT